MSIIRHSFHVIYAGTMHAHKHDIGLHRVNLDGIMTQLALP